ncbi:DUF4917 family protein [Bacillus sp. AF23]|uniref:DUF4917 family protein n=1 Tax=Bacillus sp. AF23 TaxID=2821151 RepID=UPI001E51A099|nr:DUF4917 family protein [Bacillus sp. AF23]MCC8351893.1 DUF4917 family protein [Bacillus sp. AF23]
MAELYKFETLSNEYPDLLENLLTGNGFSIEFNDNFKYGGLLDYLNHEHKLDDIEQELFKSFNTTNFEFVLNSLLTAIKINETYKIENKDLWKSYETIKQHLIYAVKGIHPERYSLNIKKLAWSFNIFKSNIFTTNYDLLSYWALLEVKRSKGENNTGDFFLGRRPENLTFQPDYFAEHQFKLYYLHGGLHFFESNGDIIKIRPDKYKILDTITNEYDKGNFPLYVSEGTYENKLAQIKRNRYLNFCYDKLLKTCKGITLFGQSLQPKYDQHLIDAIKSSNVKYIAFGVYETPAESKEFIIENTKKNFNDIGDKEILYFDSHEFFDSVKSIAHKRANTQGFGTILDEFPDLV